MPPLKRWESDWTSYLYHSNRGTPGESLVPQEGEGEGEGEEEEEEEGEGEGEGEEEGEVEGDWNYKVKEYPPYTIVIAVHPVRVLFPIIHQRKRFKCNSKTTSDYRCTTLMNQLYHLKSILF